MDLYPLGDHLFVTDNKACGGLNVTFDGVYSRTKTKSKATKPSKS